MRGTFAEFLKFKVTSCELDCGCVGDFTGIKVVGRVKHVAAGQVALDRESQDERRAVSDGG